MAAGQRRIEILFAGRETVTKVLNKVVGKVKAATKEIQARSGAMAKQLGVAPTPKVDKQQQQVARKAQLMQRAGGFRIGMAQEDVKKTQQTINQVMGLRRGLTEGVIQEKSKEAAALSEGSKTAATEAKVRGAIFGKMRSSLNGYIGIQKEFVGQSENVIESERRQQISQFGVRQVLAMNRKEWAKHVQTTRSAVEPYGKFEKTGGKLASRVRQMTHGFKGFRMEMLGVMFFGMNIHKTFSQMLQPALQLVGVLDLLRVTFEMLFLPIALVLLDALLPLMDFIITLPDEVKLAIGAFVLIAAAIGLLLFAVGSTALGIGSLILMMGGASGASTLLSGGLLGVVASAGGLTGILGGLAATIGSLALPILLIIAALALLWLAWETNFGNIRGFVDSVLKSVMAYFEGFRKFFEGIWDVLIGIVTLDSDLIMQGVGKMASGVYDIVVKGLGGIVVAVIRFGLDIIASIAGIIKGIVDWFIKLPGFIWGVLMKLPGMIVKLVFQLLEKIGLVPEGFANAAKEGVDKFMNMLRSLPKLVLKLIEQIPVIGPLIAGGVRTVGGLAAGIAGGISGGLGGISEWAGGISSGIGSLWNSITGLQHGGLVTRPTLARVAEAGPEAVIPLNKLGMNGPMTMTNYINIDANVSSDIDIREMAEKISSELQWNYRRSTLR